MAAGVTTTLTSTHASGLYIKRTFTSNIEAVGDSGHAYQDIPTTTLTEVEPTNANLTVGQFDLVCVSNLSATGNVNLGGAESGASNGDSATNFLLYCIIDLPPGQSTIFRRYSSRKLWAYVPGNAVVKIETVIIQEG